MTDEERNDLVGKPITAFLPRWFPGREAQILTSVLDHFEEHLMPQVRDYPGVKPMLNELKDGGFWLGVVSSKLKRFVEPELISTGLRSYFDIVIAFEDCAVHKPHPLPLLTAARGLGVGVPGRPV